MTKEEKTNALEGSQYLCFAKGDKESHREYLKRHIAKLEKELGQ